MKKKFEKLIDLKSLITEDITELKKVFDEIGE